MICTILSTNIEPSQCCDTNSPHEAGHATGNLDRGHSSTSPLNFKPYSFTMQLLLGCVRHRFFHHSPFLTKDFGPWVFMTFPTTVVPIQWVLWVVTWRNQASNTPVFQFLDIHNCRSHHPPWTILSSGHLEQCYCGEPLQLHSLSLQPTPLCPCSSDFLPL